MEDLLLDILQHLRRLMVCAGSAPASNDIGLTPEQLDKIVRKHNAGIRANGRQLSKRGLLPYYLRVKQNDPERWQSWNVDPTLEERFMLTVRMKPRRTASGVTTITVITRPQPCSGDCAYCPNDLRMPKSYLASEPACQRAEQAWFDPYLQVALRLRALTQMGHATDKVELIVLGGTWSDYPQPYQVWFIRELFRALNEWGTPSATTSQLERQAFYTNLGLSNNTDELERFVAPEQQEILEGKLSYNEAFAQLYGSSLPHREAARHMIATMEELVAQQQRNVEEAHRVVGLVVETRPDAVTPARLTFYRQLGCTKIQIGIQSTRQDVLDLNDRGATVVQVKRAIALIRLFGFKIHVHLMANLMGATPEQDKQDYRTLVSDPGFMPDEVKLYPCSLVAGTRLERAFHDGTWTPYTADELLDVLVADTLATPPFTRISRMVRDISAQDIIAGNKRANLRQMVDERIAAEGLAGNVHDIRSREIAGKAVDLDELQLNDYTYRTAVSNEHFLQWVTPDDRIAGFCRLSLPHWDDLVAGTTGVVDINAAELPTRPGDAMIREVHVYGHEAHLGANDSSSQHRGLGRALVARACEIARTAGYTRIHVISSIGTRAYYRKLGFSDNGAGGLYQTRKP